MGAECNGDPPWFHGMSDADDASVAPYERDIDCESHEKSVNPTRWRDDQRMTLVQPIASEQASTAARRIEGADQRMRQTPTRPGVHEYHGAARLSQKRREESFLHGSDLLTTIH
jgi:hypothetical protein